MAEKEPERVEEVTMKPPLPASDKKVRLMTKKCSGNLVSRVQATICDTMLVGRLVGRWVSTYLGASTSSRDSMPPSVALSKLLSMTLSCCTYAVISLTQSFLFTCKGKFQKPRLKLFK